MSSTQQAPTPRRRTRSTFVAVVVAAAILTGLLGCRPADSWPSGVPHVVADADGDVPAGVTAFDDEYPAVGSLDPALLGALRRASTDAMRGGVGLYVNSGWRSAAYQQRLLSEAVATYGSTADAARWVATPATSPHVSGDAVDIGGTGAVAWLADHGARYGLCQIYGNEPWHFELRPDAVGHGCPHMYADPTHDPRMQP